MLHAVFAPEDPPLALTFIVRSRLRLLYYVTRHADARSVDHEVHGAELILDGR